MKKEVMETVKVLAAGLAAMVVLPLAYRAWQHCHPQPEEPRRTLSEVLAKSVEERAMQLLRTPLSGWTEHDRRAEPKIHAWLEAHESTVLPWEWTDEARRKDPSGYRNLWHAVVREQGLALNSRMKALKEGIKAIERALQTAETIYAHRTNQIARVVDYAATNAFPMTVKVERLSKGRFWGWNRKVEEAVFERSEDFAGAGKGWLAMEREVAAEERSAIGGKLVSKMEQERALAVVEELVRRVAEFENLDEKDDGARISEMCRLINAEGAVDSGQAGAGMKMR